MPGSHSGVEPPLPIPNRTVKRSRADDSGLTARESRSPPGTPSPNAPPENLRTGAFDFAPPRASGGVPEFAGA